MQPVQRLRDLQKKNGQLTEDQTSWQAHWLIWQNDWVIGKLAWFQWC